MTKNHIPPTYNRRSRPTDAASIEKQVRLVAQTPLKPIRCAIYCHTAADDEHSLVRQDIACTGFVSAKFPNANIAGRYSDSGKDRSARQRLLEDAANGAFDALIVADIDRLSRKLAEMGEIWALLKGFGITLYSPERGAVRQLDIMLQGFLGAEVKQAHGLRVKEGLARAAARRREGSEK